MQFCRNKSIYLDYTYFNIYFYSSAELWGYTVDHFVYYLNQMVVLVAAIAPQYSTGPGTGQVQKERVTEILLQLPLQLFTQNNMI